MSGRVLSSPAGPGYGSGSVAAITYTARRRWTGITGVALLATLTPFCAYGTTAVLLGVLTTEAPIVAFMVGSALTDPSGLLLSAGLFGWIARAEARLRLPRNLL